MLIYPHIDPVAFAIGPLTLAGYTLGPLRVHWYGIMYLVGFGLAWLLAMYRTKREDLVVRKEQVDDLIFYGAMGVVLGARIGYILFYKTADFMAEPLMIFRVWEGGMSFHGGFLGVILAMYLYSKKIQQRFFDVMDFIAPMVPVGLFFGRLGNFIGAELYGRAADVPWAMVFPTDTAQIPRHPSQLYEAGLEGLLTFLILFVWYSAKPRPRAAVCSLFVLLYGCFRFAVEFFRQPDAHIGYELFGFLSRGQELCIPMILVGGGVFIWANLQAKKNKV